MREKVGKSRNIVFFQWFVAPEGLKVGSLKRRVRSQLARGEMKNCTPLWREVHFQVKMYKTHHDRTTFGSWDIEKVHAVVARSTFPSQNAQNTPRSDHFWKLRCCKSARRCGAKHIPKSKCTKHTSFGPLLEVEMSKKCTPLWREAHFEVKSAKNWGVRSTFGRSDVASRGRCEGLCTVSKVSKTWGFCSIFSHYTTVHSNTLQLQLQLQLHLHYILHYTPLHYTALNYTQLYYTTLHYTTLHYTTLHYTTLHYSHYTSLHYTTLHSTILQLQLHNYNPLHSTTLLYTKLHHTTLHYTRLHYTTLHYTTLHYLPLHSATYTTLHSTTLQLQLQLQLHNYTPLHSTTLNYTTLHYTTLHYTTLHYFHYTSLHYITLQSTTLQLQLQLHNYTPLQSTTFHYTPLH